MTGRSSRGSNAEDGVLVELVREVAAEAEEEPPYPTVTGISAIVSLPKMSMTFTATT